MQALQLQSKRVRAVKIINFIITMHTIHTHYAYDHDSDRLRILIEYVYKFG
jgi:hypothetical protein